MSNWERHHKATNQEQLTVLKILLTINALMFFVELASALLSDSTALMADSLDMLADATVYGIGLYAVGKSALQKAQIAYFSGILEVILGLGAGLKVFHKFLFGSEPESVFMIVIGILALIANVICLKLIYQHRNGDIHMRASWIFSKNDVLANLGVVIAGFLVWWLDSQPA